MLAESTNVWDALITVAQVAGTIGVAWIAWQQVRDRSKNAEARAAMIQASREQRQATNDMQTTLGEFTQTATAIMQHPERR